MVVVTAALSGCAAASTLSSPVSAGSTTDASSTQSPSSADSRGTGTAVAALAALPVKGRAPKTGYQRSAFGQAWADVDRNGCDTRNDILRRDARDVTLKPGTNGCVVASGTLQDRYSGTAFRFVRGDGQVEIDHVVALSDAWQKGAQAWTAETRAAFANDPLNLVATESALNQQKGDGDAATWLPPYGAGRCAYVARQIAVKKTYGLWLTVAERDAMGRVLAGCPREPLPSGDDRAPLAAG
ncbi:DUF1524 domain-containing protein [Raineyella fluvialis]|uniref:DUF1524 domain-containing protein n=2 Tax=Raineyella fluvialis TaxID=2662261 RepID=A0A5Q2FI72_9ACTN|nr:DUF1524 domain-containing protein [Raineyella fluvialis]